MTAASLSESLVAFLDGLGGVTWYPLRLPESCALPAGTYQRISDVPVHTHDGVSSLRPRRYQLTIYSERYTEGLAAALVVVLALAGIRDTWSGWTVTSMLVDDAEDIDPEPRGLFRQRVDVMITSEAP